MHEALDVDEGSWVDHFSIYPYHIPNVFKKPPKLLSKAMHTTAFAKI